MYQVRSSSSKAKSAKATSRTTASTIITVAGPTVGNDSTNNQRRQPLPMSPRKDNVRRAGLPAPAVPPVGAAPPLPGGRPADGLPPPLLPS